MGGTIILVITIFLLPLMRFLTRAGGADKIIEFGKKKPSPVKFDLETFPIALGLLLLAILAFCVSPITALIIVTFAMFRGIQMILWAVKKIKLKENAPENLKTAVPAKLIVAGIVLISFCGLAVYFCYLIENVRPAHVSLFKSFQW